jgi:hypothetical protein
MAHLTAGPSIRFYFAIVKLYFVFLSPLAVQPRLARAPERAITSGETLSRILLAAHGFLVYRELNPYLTHAGNAQVIRGRAGGS